MYFYIRLEKRIIKRNALTNQKVQINAIHNQSPNAKRIWTLDKFIARAFKDEN